MQTYGGKTVQSCPQNGVHYRDRFGLLPPVPPQQQGDYLARSFLVNYSQGIPLSIWYDWKNDGTGFGFTSTTLAQWTAGLVLKPAYYKMKTLTTTFGEHDLHQ